MSAFFLDTYNLDEIRLICCWGLVDGVANSLILVRRKAMRRIRWI
ncbi:hypothetical protein DSUL_80051 [Desulfovibrionales bacterium]